MARRGLILLDLAKVSLTPLSLGEGDLVMARSASPWLGEVRLALASVWQGQALPKVDGVLTRLEGRRKKKKKEKCKVFF